MAKIKGWRNLNKDVWVGGEDSDHSHGDTFIRVLHLGVEDDEAPGWVVEESYTDKNILPKYLLNLKRKNVNVCVRGNYRFPSRKDYRFPSRGEAFKAAIKLMKRRPRG